MSASARLRRAASAESGAAASASLAGGGQPRRRGQWTRLVPSASELRDRKTEALYRAAAISFHRNGYAGTSLADIAERLGVSKAALYHYIGNKQELLLGCHLAASDAADRAVARVPKTGLNGRDKVRLALRYYLESILAEDSASVVVLEESALTPENFRIVVARRDVFQAAFTRFIREGIRDGSIVRCDPQLATFAVLGGVNWVEKWYRPGGAWSRLQIAHAMADMMVRAISSEPCATFPERVSEYPEIAAADEVAGMCDAPGSAPRPATRPAGAEAAATRRRRAKERADG